MKYLIIRYIFVLSLKRGIDGIKTVNFFLKIILDRRFILVDLHSISEQGLPLKETERFCESLKFISIT
jgi:hypothetical protein